MSEHPHTYAELEERLRRMEARLDRLEAELTQARADARRGMHGGWPTEGQRYYESGTVHPELDDQTITPPG